MSQILNHKTICITKIKNHPPLCDIKFLIPSIKSFVSFSQKIAIDVKTHTTKQATMANDEKKTVGFALSPINVFSSLRTRFSVSASTSSISSLVSEENHFLFSF